MYVKKQKVICLYIGSKTLEVAHNICSIDFFDSSQMRDVRSASSCIRSNCLSHDDEIVTTVHIYIQVIVHT